ncbi:MAG: type II toxin-antitoxin system RelE/ParE family toxin [Nanoarchaeota archaeon]|nr:type II toxin-antitoxin system RelE/ParE family toxin [Nanoarchaeota archaeon]
MSFKIEWNPKAYKDFLKLPKAFQIRVVKKLDFVKENPFRYLEHYEAKKLYKLRVGDYRALIDLDLKEKILLIQVFDHRKRIYKY